MFLSFDIGGTTTKYGVVTREGQIIEKDTIKTEDNKEQFLSDIFSIIEKIQENYAIEGIGMSAPGIIKEDGSMMTAGAILSLYGENIKKYIEEYTGLTVTIDNDANAAAIAEKWLGNAQNMKNYVCLVLGTGVGGGIVINNQVYSGANGMAGEIGWGLIKELPEGNSLEDVSINKRAAIVGGLCKLYNDEKRLMDSNSEEIFDAREIFRREAEGEEIAKRVLESFFTDLSVGILNVISFFDPEAVLIGGGISQNEVFEKRLLEKITELKKRHESINRISHLIDTPVIMAKLKNDAGMLGATYQIKQKIDGTN